MKTEIIENQAGYEIIEIPYIQRKVIWHKIPAEIFIEIEKHAERMSQRNYHREHRSGGKEYRNKESIFKNARDGKAGEQGIYTFFSENEIECSLPNLEIYERGKWDEYDLSIFIENIKYVINCKTIPSYGRMILLEVKDYHPGGRLYGKFDFLTISQVAKEPNQNQYTCYGIINEAQVRKIINRQWSNKTFLRQGQKYKLEGTCNEYSDIMDADNFVIHIDDTWVMNEFFSSLLNKTTSSFSLQL